VQLISSYYWDSKLLGPVPAKARLGGLFEGKSYELIKKTKPELAYQLYVLGQVIENSIKEFPWSKRAFAWQALFTLFSLCTKSLQSAKMDFGAPAATKFLESAYPSYKWIKFCKGGVDHIRSVYRRDTRKYLSETGQELTNRRACSAQAPPLALPGTLLACLPPAVSSTRKSTAGTNRAHDKTLSHSVRYVPARKPAFATSSRPSLSAWSCRNIAMRRESLQDGVRLALTVNLQICGNL
jgi:hypothetical protein